MIPHTQSLQIQLPDGTINGKINQNLPPIINTDISLLQLARYLYYSKEQMELIDWACYHIASKTFTSTALFRAHASNSFNYLWYVDAQANKFNKDLSQIYRCCQSGKSKYLHIIAYPSHAQTHDKYRPQVSHREEIGEATQKGPK